MPTNMGLKNVCVLAQSVHAELKPLFLPLFDRTQKGNQIRNTQKWGSGICHPDMTHPLMQEYIVPRDPYSHRSNFSFLLQWKHMFPREGSEFRGEGDKSLTVGSCKCLSPQHRTFPQKVILFLILQYIIKSRLLKFLLGKYLQGHSR